MSLNELMALVPIPEISTLDSANNQNKSGRKSRWEKTKEKIKNEENLSRWGSVDDKPYLPPPYVDLPAGLSPSQVDQFLREQRYEELSLKLSIGDLEYGDPDIRPPSPPPIYDKNGSRINTRDARVRNSMQSEYYRLIEYLLKTVAGFVAPPDYRPVKKTKKIEIPIDKFPEYNFMGLIIGPRGCNHKRLEAESGAQISVRGKGTQKEGKRTDHQNDEEALLPMHVHISADTEEAVEKAANLIEPLLDPFHPMHEIFKKRGLEQLALVNGIQFQQLDLLRCAVCSAVGHIAAECPDAQQLQNFKKPEIKCSICGDMGHVTMDCKLRKTHGENAAVVSSNVVGAGAGAPNFYMHGGVPGQKFNIPPPPYTNNINTQQQYYEKLKMDQEYNKMMSELTGESVSTEEESGEKMNNNSMDNSISPGVPGMNSFNMGNEFKTANGEGVGVVGGIGNTGASMRTNVVTPPPGVSPSSSSSLSSCNMHGFYSGKGVSPNGVESPLVHGTNPFGMIGPPVDNIGAGGMNMWPGWNIRGARTPRMLLPGVGGGGMGAQWRQPFPIFDVMGNSGGGGMGMNLQGQFGPGGRGPGGGMPWMNGVMMHPGAAPGLPYIRGGRPIWIPPAKNQPPPPADNDTSTSSTSPTATATTTTNTTATAITSTGCISSTTANATANLTTSTNTLPLATKTPNGNIMPGMMMYPGIMGGEVGGMGNPMLGGMNALQMNGNMLNMPNMFPINSIAPVINPIENNPPVPHAPSTDAPPLPPGGGGGGGGGMMVCEPTNCASLNPLDPNQMAQAQMAVLQMTMMGAMWDPKSALGMKMNGINGVVNGDEEFANAPPLPEEGAPAKPPEPPKSDDFMDTSV